MTHEVPNIRHLRVFLEVVACKSISKASQKVFLSQPAITQAIVKLETLLDTLLFKRRSDGMFATPAGLVFALRVRRAIEMIRTGLKGAIRLGGSKCSGNKGSSPAYLLQALTTTQLRALIAVSQAHNFSIAARELGISQSSVHRAARELESLLGIELFEKTSTGISASKAAQVLAKASKLAFSEIAQGRDEINILHNREIGQIVIGSMPLVRTTLLPEAILKLSAEFPDFKIRVNDGHYNDLLSHLRHGDIDLLLGALRFPLPASDVVQEELFSARLAIVGRHDHPLCRGGKGRGDKGRGDRIATTDLQDYSWVLPLQGTPTRAIFESLFVEQQLDTPGRIIETGSQVLTRSLLLGSDALTMISKHQIQHELELGVLKIIDYKLAHSDRLIGITYRSSWKPTSTQQSLLNMLRELAYA